MNVDGVIISIANQLVEILQMPAQMAWQAGIEYTRLSGTINITVVVSSLLLIGIPLILVWKWVIEKEKKASSWDKGDCYPIGLAATFLLFMFSLAVVPCARFTAIQVLKIIYPEPMLIYQIIEKVLQ